jgi:hypothetical protein
VDTACSERQNWISLTDIGPDYTTTTVHRCMSLEVQGVISQKSGIKTIFVTAYL